MMFFTLNFTANQFFFKESLNTSLELFMLERLSKLEFVFEQLRSFVLLLPPEPVDLYEWFHPIDRSK